MRFLTGLVAVCCLLWFAFEIGRAFATSARISSFRFRTGSTSRRAHLRINHRAFVWKLDRDLSNMLEFAGKASHGYVRSSKYVSYTMEDLCCVEERNWWLTQEINGEYGVCR